MIPVATRVPRKVVQGRGASQMPKKHLPGSSKPKVALGRVELYLDYGTAIQSPCVPSATTPVAMRQHSFLGLELLFFACYDSHILSQSMYLRSCTCGTPTLATGCCGCSAAAAEHGAHSLPDSAEGRFCIADTAGVLEGGVGLLAAVGAVDRSGDPTPGSTDELMLVSESAAAGPAYVP